MPDTLNRRNGMKFKFKIQQYQTDAVESVVAVFAGQPNRGPEGYSRPLSAGSGSLPGIDNLDDGYRNSDVELSSGQLLDNLRKVQGQALLPLSDRLSRVKGLGAVNLDVEMETGTGKTYVYIKTMFELNKRFGWSKFIVVVPSVAIREGVKKSFELLQDHFMEHYGKKAHCFIYNSSKLNELDGFSKSSGIEVMIINTQAFATSMKEGANNKESRIIYSEQDSFGSRRPIDVIAANHPIIIMDEPQKMDGAVTQSALVKFQPLFVLNYSATHKTKHDTVYSLDALDAYKQKLVKRISVKGFEIKNLRGVSGYLYLDGIVLSPKHPPLARIELEVKTASGTIVRKVKTFGVGDSLRDVSGLAEYDGFTVSEVNADGYVTFLNGTTIRRGELLGDDSELHMQRVQIRETIMSHLEKERMLFARGIKCLSLFFIDEVAKYKSYDDEGREVKGVFQSIFEEEYSRLVEGELNGDTSRYGEYLRQFSAADVHRGYFSVDKKSGRAIDGKVERKNRLSDDISAYELILKNKERLLSFDEPTRFIFSHSALREGWDNPNVFQICTLRHANSDTAKRQEVGRGLRLCVDQTGRRMDAEVLGDEVHELNKLTVIANESYAAFTTALQRDTQAAMRERVTKATISYFAGRNLLIDGEPHTITETEAGRIMTYLDDNGYIKDDGSVTPVYREAVENKTLAPLPAKLQPIAAGVIALVNSIFDSDALNGFIEEEKPTHVENRLNDNFYKAEFQALWNEINHQYVYRVKYDSDELIANVVSEINAKLTVNRLRYVKVEGAQVDGETIGFGGEQTQTSNLDASAESTVAYDLVGEIAKGANITRRSVAKILKGIAAEKLGLFKNNPEEFLRKVIGIVKEQKSTMIVEHISYNVVAETYDSDIFTVPNPDHRRAIQAKRHVTDYVVFDSDTERRFAQDLDGAGEVEVFAKLPRSFQIPTPVGNYAPDWAIAFKKGVVKHIFFIAETKGKLSNIDLRPIEKSKIACAKKLFNELSTSNVRYHEVESIEDLRNYLNEPT